MNKDKIFIFPMLIATLLFTNLAFGSSTSSEVQMAIGTYQPDHYWNQAFILNNQHDGSWIFQKAPWGNQLSGNLYKIHCIDKTCIATASTEVEINGHYQWGMPLFLMSNDYGKNWYVNKNITGLPEMRGGSTSRINCTDKICIAAGAYEDKGIHLLPLLLISYNYGQSWAYVNNLPYPTSKSMEITGALSAITCTNKTCLVAGFYHPNADEEKLIMFSSDANGQTWSLAQSVTGVPDKTTRLNINRIKCNNKICIAAGVYDTDDDRGVKEGRRILLLLSQDEGQNWKAIKTIPELSKTKYITVNDLIYSKDSFILVGAYANYYPPTKIKSLILVGRKQGKSWSLINEGSNIHSNKLFTTLRTINCTDNTCIAGGDKDVGLNFIISTNNGTSWEPVANIIGLKQIPNIEKVQCNSSHCTAFGNYFKDSYHPLIIVSNDRGKSWNMVNKITNFPEGVDEIHFADSK